MIDFLTPVIVQAGLACLAAQCVFYVLFAYILPKGPWTAMPGFTAHQVVAFPLMVYMAYQGIKTWYFSDFDEAGTGPFDTSYDRILKVHPVGIELAEIAVGIQLFWDTPLGLITPALYDPIMLAHHIGMFFTGSQLAGTFGRSVGSYHAIFFAGVVELSSIPLVFVDIFHPKHKPWFQYLQGKDPSSFLHVFNEACRVTFAIGFLIVRGVLFPYEIFTACVPDLIHVASLPEEERDGATLSSIFSLIFISVFFSVLQMYWAFLVSRQTVKAIFGSGEKKKV